MAKSEENPFLFLQHTTNNNNKHAKNEDEWLMIMDGDHDDDDIYTTSSSSSTDDEGGSVCSSSDDHAVDIDDASSKSNGPLFELSELMACLPIKRGLSKYYQGKSESFTSLAGAISIEDVAKKGRNPSRRKMMKASKSYGNGLDAHKPYTLPKPIISKKVSRSSCLSSLSFPGSRRGGGFLTNSRPPPVPLQKKV